MSTIADLKTLLSHRDPAQPVVVDVDPVTVWTGPASELQGPLGVVFIPTETILYQATVTDWLNVRSGAGIANPLVGKYSPGTVVDVLSDAPQTANGYTWVKTHGKPSFADTKIVGWAASQWLKRVAPPTVAHKLGLHSLLDGRSRVEEFLKAGARLASITIVGDWGYANEMAQSVPYAIYRRADPTHPAVPDDETQARVYGHQFVRNEFASDNELGDLDLQVAIQLWNEEKWKPGHGGFNLGVLEELTAMGRRGVMANYAVGQPEPNEWQTLQPALEYAKANGHLVGLHCYCAPSTPIGQLSADGPDYELRFVRLYNSVPESARPTLVISEFAHEFTRGKFEGVEPLISTAKLYRDAIAPYPYVGGFNLYTVGKLGGWDTSCIDSALTDSGVLALFK